MEHKYSEYPHNFSERLCVACGVRASEYAKNMAAGMSPWAAMEKANLAVAKV